MLAPHAITTAKNITNSLNNIKGFSTNSNFPVSHNFNLPALEGVASSQVVKVNLNTMHAAREAFIQMNPVKRLSIF